MIHKQIMTRWCALLLSILLVATISACGGAGGGNSGVASGGEQKTADPTPKKQEEKKPVTLVFQHIFQGFDLEAMEKITKLYQAKNPHVTINLVALGGAAGERLNTLNSKIAAGEQIDVIMVDPSIGVGEMAVRDWVLPLNDRIKTNQLDMKKYFEGMEKRVTYNNSIYALPFYHHQFMMFYDKKLFDKYGVAYPKNDWTYDDFAAAVRKLTNKNDDSVGLANAVTLYNAVGGAFGGQTFNEAGTQLTVDSGDAVKGYEFLTNLIKEGVDGISPGAKEKGFNGKYVYGSNVGMIVTFTNKFQTYDKDNINYGLAPLPKGPKKQQGLGLLFGLSVSKSSKNPDEAFKFIQYLSADKEANIELAKSGVSIPLIDDAEVVAAWEKTLKSKDMADSIMYAARKTNEEGLLYLNNKPGYSFANDFWAWLTDRSKGPYAGTVDLFAEVPNRVKKSNADWAAAQKAAEKK